MFARNIITQFSLHLNRLVNKNVLSSTSLMRYWDYNVHSYLQYCLIKAAEDAGLMGIPEYRLRLSKPIDKYSVDSRLKNKRIRFLKTIRVDVGFLEGSRLIGIGEVYTPDEIHGCLPSEQLESPWITPYDKLLHMARYEKGVEFIVLIVGLWMVSGWRDARRRTPLEWYECWKNAVEQLSTYKQVAAVYIKGLDDIETKLLNGK